MSKKRKRVTNEEYEETKQNIEDWIDSMPESCDIRIRRRTPCNLAIYISEDEADYLLAFSGEDVE